MLRLLAATLALCLLPLESFAANLLLGCTAANASTRTSTTPNLCPNANLVWVVPAANDYVISARTSTAANPWGASDTVFRRYADVLATDRVHYCSLTPAAGATSMVYSSCAAAQRLWATKASLTLATEGVTNATGAYKLSWAAPADNGALIIGYRVYSAATGSPLGLLASVFVPGLEYVVTGVQNGSYDYAVTAYTADTESVKSSTITVVVNITAPGPLIPNAPSGIQVIEFRVTSP